MSEYQYYEFQSLERSLTNDELSAISKLSSRVELSKTKAIFTYSYGDFPGNPPFGLNGVARHTTHAYNFLKPGGILVSLSHHYQLQPSRTDRQFFAWLFSKNARFLNCGRAFSQSDKPNGMAPLRSTVVPLQIILIPN
jgi:hypothetical protein